MAISREDLQTKRTELEGQMEQVQQNASAISGAIQLVDQLLALLDEREKKGKAKTA